MAGEDCKYCGDNLLELYDLDKDIGETTDLSDQMPELTQSMHDELLTFLSEANAETELHPRDHAYNVMLKKMDIQGSAIQVESEYRSPFKD